MADKRTQHKELPFSGKMMTAEPAEVGANFQTLKNLRYTDGHLKGISGMAKINVTALSTYPRVKSAFHFNKVDPAESHLLVQAYTTAETTAVMLQNTATIPGTAAFSSTALWSDASGFGLGRFSDAADQQMIYCNGVESCIWGGNEINCGAFLTSTAAITDSGTATSPKDYTDIINNSKQDGASVAVIGGGIDAYTVLMLHGDGADASTTITDSSSGGKAMTANGDAQIDASQAKFGTGSILFDGMGDTVTTPDHADFNMGTGTVTVDFWARFTAQGIDDGLMGFFSQTQDANNIVQMYWSKSYGILFKVTVAASNTISVSGDAAWVPTANTWYHIALIRGWGGNANDWAITIDGAQTGTTTTDDSTWPDLTGNFTIGPAMAGWLDEFRVSKGIARWTANFTPPAKPYASQSLYWLVGSPRPLQGLKYYVSNGNLTASTMTGKEWNGSTWNTLTLTDNTDTGASLAATGTVTFSSTINTAKPKYLEGYFLYWYQFAIDAGEAEIYRVTLDAPFQEIVDMWDGVFRSITRFYKYTTAYLDNSVNVLADDYDAGTASTYCDLSSMGAYSSPNNCLEIGFTEKMAGIRFDMAPDYLNSTAGTTMYIDYWNGTAYTSVGTITDGTAEGGISLAKTGVASWNNNSLSDETKKSVANSPPLYYYRVRFDEAMDAAVRINYVTGITAQNDISYYKFPVFAQGRTLLCCDMSGERHKVRVSSKFMPQVYNGDDSVDVFFGDGGELTGGIELFSLFGNSLYSLVFMFKDTETWVVAGTDIQSWDDGTYLLSNTIGCPAPLTIKTINLASEPGAGINRMLVVWQGASGVYMSDGRAPIPIHGDIKEYFDRQDSRCIRASKVGDSIAFIDPTRQEYHLLIASGSGATTLNTELVYDIHRNKWFEIERSADLQCGVLVHDTDGNDYDYGFINTGYCERLEYGTTSDGSDITHTVQFGDMALAGLGRETQVDHVRLITVAKTTTTNSATLTHYGDGNATGTAKTLSPARSGYRLAQPYFDEHLTADPFHSFKIAMTTNDETIGFEPLALVVSYHATHQD